MQNELPGPILEYPQCSRSLPHGPFPWLLPAVDSSCAPTIPVLEP